MPKLPPEAHADTLYDVGRQGQVHDEHEILPRSAR